MKPPDRPEVGPTLSGLAVGEVGVVAAEGVEFAVGADDVGAAAVDAVFVPVPGVHEGFDEEAEGVAFAEFELFEEVAEGGVVAAAFEEVFEAVVDLVLEEALDFGEVDEVGDGADAEGGLEEVADGGAVGVAAGEGGEVFEAETVVGLGDGAEDDVGGV